MSEAGPCIVFGGSFTYRAPVRVGIQHYAGCFARHGWRAAYIASQLSPWHLLRRSDRLFAREKLRLWIRGGEWQDGVFSYAYMTLLPILPNRSPGFVVRNTLRCAVPAIGHVLRSRGLGEPDVLWIENPHLAALPDHLPHRVLVYRVADELQGFRGASPNVLAAHEAAVARADLVIATARTLAERYRGAGLRGTVLYLPNGVDFEHFRRPDPPRPREYESFRGPVALYAGSIAAWFDQALLAECARRLPRVNFVLVGPRTVNLRALRGVSNVHLLGSRPYEDMPSYYRHADVGLIPFRPGKLVDAVNPVKLYEYMAAGLPVVATDWPELRNMRAPVRPAATPDRFAEQVREALTEEDPRPYITYARGHSWTARYETLQRELARRTATS